MTENSETTSDERPTRRRGGRSRGRAVSSSADPQASARESRFDTSVPSPCVSVCQFNGESFCRGCYRNIDEIRDWMIMSREQKLAVLDTLSQRRLDETGEQLW